MKGSIQENAELSIALVEMLNSPKAESIVLWLTSSEHHHVGVPFLTLSQAYIMILDKPNNLTGPQILHLLNGDDSLILSWLMFIKCLENFTRKVLEKFKYYL